MNCRSEYECEWLFVSFLSLWTIIDWEPAQDVPWLLPYDCSDSHQPPITRNGLSPIDNRLINKCNKQLLIQ